MGSRSNLLHTNERKVELLLGGIMYRIIVGSKERGVMRTLGRMKNLLKGRFLTLTMHNIYFSNIKIVCRVFDLLLNTQEFLRLAACCDLSEMEVQQRMQYIKGLKFSIHEKMGLQPIWTVDEACNLALNARRLMVPQPNRTVNSRQVPFELPRNNFENEKHVEVLIYLSVVGR